MECIVFGDFYSPSFRWNDKKPTSVGQNLEDFIDTLSLDQIQVKNENDCTNSDLVLAHTNVGVGRYFYSTH